MDTKLKINFYSIFIKTILAFVILVSAIVAGNMLSRANVLFPLLFPNDVIVNNLNLSWEEFEPFVSMSMENPENLSLEQQEWLNEMTQRGYIFAVFHNQEFYPYPGDAFFLEVSYYSDDINIQTYVTPEAYYAEYDRLSGDIATAEIYLWIFVVALVFIAAASILFGVLAGQKERGGEVVIFSINRIFNDILTFVVGIIILTIFFFVGNIWADIIFYTDYVNYMEMQLALGNIALYGSIVFLCLLWLYYLNCIAKRIKRREFFGYTILGFVFKQIKEFFKNTKRALKSVTDTKTLNYIAMFAIGFVALTVMLPLTLAFLFGSPSTYLFLSMFITPTAIGLFAYGIIRRLGELDSIKTGLNEVRAGNLGHRIPPIKSTILTQMVEDINNISDGFSNSVEAAMVSERMKTELITNVSHDLKTPLTSIIGYTELLSKVENLPDEARDYSKILESKSTQLSMIISDLFDLAKSSSGNVELNMEELSYKRLIEQTLADLQDNIEESNVILKTSLPDEEIIITADGNKMSRVFKNIIDNALKYSLNDSRIYVRLVTENNIATAEIINTSAAEMNFTEQEILQRFVRGDDSRTTEGSGLGLSIAKSFTELCKGKFILKIEGDMFKVSVSFPTMPQE